MKIVLTVHQFLPDYTTGTEILTFEAAKGLQRLGHEVNIVAGFPARPGLSEEGKSDAYVYEGLQVERFYAPIRGLINISEAEYRNLEFAAYFSRFLERTAPDLVHFFHLEKLSASAVEVCRLMGIPTVLTPTDFWFVCPTIQLRLPDGSMCRGPNWKAANCVAHLAELKKPNTMKSPIPNIPDSLLGLAIWANQSGILKSRWLDSQTEAVTDRRIYLREQLSKIDRVLVPTRLMEDILTSNGLGAENIVFAPYGINLSCLQRHHRSFRKNNELRVGFIGTLSEHKGAHVLVEAARSLPRAFPVVLKIFGRTEDFPDYFARLRQLAGGEPRIQFCGAFPNADIDEILSTLDVLVVPSIWYENTPLVIYSSQAAGCPVVASNLGGMAEVIRHEHNGLLFKPGGVVELADALKRLCEEPDLLEGLAKRAIMPRSIQDYVRQMEAVYEDIVGPVESPVHHGPGASLH